MMRLLVNTVALWQVNLIVWLAVTIVARPSLAVAILLGGVLVLIPLGRALLRTTTSDSPLGITSLCDLLQSPAGWLLALSFIVAPGGLAASLAVPWFLFTLLCASEGTWRLVHSPWTIDATFARHAGLLLLAVGGGWAVISRWGLRPMDFSAAIVLLTAVHFHYAGFILPLLTARVANAWPRWTGVMLILAVLAGVPLVGVGITFSPLLEVIAAILLTGACIGVALGQFRLAASAHSPHEMVLLLISSISLLTAMGFAAVYAVGEFTGAAHLSIETMIATHGLANSVGFAACGLFAWQIATKQVPPRAAGDSI